MAVTSSSLGSNATQPRRSSFARRERLWGLIFLAPWIAGFLLFFAAPMVASFVFSFTDFNLLSAEPMKFTGLTNWQRLIDDPLVRRSLWVTLRFILISVPVLMAVPIAFAVLVNSRYLFGKKLFRALFYMPMMVPLVASTIIWQGILNPQSGWVNRLLASVNVPGPNWFGDGQWVLPALTIIGLWGIGNTMVIMLAGLQSVPTELYEAARVDGAGPIRSFFKITLPMMSPVIFYNLVLAVIGGFQYFLQAYVIYNNQSGPDKAALFYMLNLYKEAFVYYQMGYASTLGWAMFIVALLVTITLFVTAKRWVYYAGGEA